jgi:hypothetical protein
LLAPGYRKIYFDELKELKAEWQAVFNMHSSERSYEDDYRMTSFSSFPEKAEGTSIQYLEPTPGGTKRYSWTPRGAGFRVTFEMYQDDLYKVSGQRMSKELARAAHYQMEVDNWGLLNDAFSGSTYTGFDSLALCSTAHTRLDGGTNQANKPSTDLDLSITALQAAYVTINGWKSDVGRPVVFTPKIMVISPDQAFVAEEMLKSEYKPFTGDNEINSVKSVMKLSYMISHYLTDTDAWYILCDNHDMNHFWRNKLMFQNGDDFDTGDAKYKGYYRDGRGFGRWYGVYGSSGG